MALVAVAVASSAIGPGQAAAEERPPRLSVGAGYSGAVLGPPTHGPVAYASVLPGGIFGRLGVHGEVRGLRGTSPRWYLGGLSYEAAAARPHIQVELRAEAGAVATEGVPVIGGGARWHLWIVGPVAAGVDGAAHLWIDGAQSELVLSAALTLGASF